MYVSHWNLFSNEVTIFCVELVYETATMFTEFMTNFEGNSGYTWMKALKHQKSSL